MQISHQALASHLQKNMKAVYVLTGSDTYLLNEAVLHIKKAWRHRGETDEKILDINTVADWALLQEEAYSYSLFSELVLLDIRFDKKTIDATGKGILNQYLKNINPRCLIIFQASAVPAKQLQWLAADEQVALVQIASLTESALQQWIKTQLHTRKIKHRPEIPELIYQYSQNNMLACAQSIEKLALVCEEEIELSIDDVKAQLIDQCEFQLYELADACLSANSTKALHLLSQAYHTRSEPTLILWILTQEIRQLIQLSCLLNQQINFAAACNQLKIWPKRIKLYEKASARFKLPKLYQLLQDSKRLDEKIKTSQGNQIWQSLERLALALCLGSLVTL